MAESTPIVVPVVVELSESNTAFSSISGLYRAFSEKREALGLSNPGTVESVAREVQRDVFLNNSMFTGLRADIAKSFSAAPLFQTSHALSMGSQGLAPYTFLATYGTPKAGQFTYSMLRSD